MTLIQGAKKRGDEQFTPVWVFEALGLEFDLDPAHPPYKTNVPCKNYYTKDDNGLEKDWFGLVWVNPPYSQPSQLVDKFLEHNNGLMLIPMAKSRWFTELWNMRHVSILPMVYNIKFEAPDGTKQTIFTPTCLIAVNKVATKALQNSNLGLVR